MENQEILILKKIKNLKKSNTKNDKTKKKGGKQKLHCQNK